MGYDCKIKPRTYKTGRNRLLTLGCREFLSFVLVGSPFTVVAKTPRRPCQDQFAILLRSVVVALKPRPGRGRKATRCVGVVVVGKTCSRSFFVLSWSRLNRGRVWTGRRRDDLDVVGVVDDDANDASKFNAVPGNLISKFVSRNLK